jgi:hypothetical protein
MKAEVASAIEELRRQFDSATVTLAEDGQGGARVVVEPVSLGPRFRPSETWIGFHIPAQYPYADIYPMFIGGDCTRVDGVILTAPVTSGHQFEGRGAIQVSRRSAAAGNGQQTAVAKVLKVLDFLAQLP